MGTGRSTDIANAYGAVAVTKSDATVIPTTRALYIGTTGDVVVTMAHGETPITFKTVPVGVLPVQVTQVLDATTASNIVAMY